MGDPREQSAHDEQDEDMTRRFRLQGKNRGDHRSSPTKGSNFDGQLEDGQSQYKHAIDGSGTIHSGVPPYTTPCHDDFHMPHEPRQLYTDLARTTPFPSTPSDVTSAASQRIPSPNHHSQDPSPPAFTPLDRSLPSRSVTNEDLDDTYVAFILYCNPIVPLDTDSGELRKGFRSPPKNDGKSFDTYRLFELIQKLNEKEIKTWTQLTVQLGVEPPIMEKNQSTQKLQQYAVRLKRWMHAMHVDAFFEFCLEKSHSYYAHIPPPQAAYLEFDRDGVPFEEDLALRALLPDLKPKRGRRKGEEKNPDDEKGTSPVKRPRLDTAIPQGNSNDIGPPQSALFPSSAVALSSDADDMDRYVNHLDPSTAASTITQAPLSTGQTITPHPSSSASTGQHFRWRVSAQDHTMPATPHLDYSMTPVMGHAMSSVAFEEPQSAITPSASGRKSRTKKRHGPVVSSAWPGGGSLTTGKLRGRPSGNRTVTEGHFSTFPANPQKAGRTGKVMENLNMSAKVDRSEDPGHGPMRRPQSEVSPLSPPPARPSYVLERYIQTKPSALHLKVPKPIGGPVRIGTPTLLVNGESDHFTSPNAGARVQSHPMTFFDDSDSLADEGEDQLQSRDNTLLGLELKELIQDFAVHLTTAKVEGDETQLDLKRAQRLSARVVRGLKHQFESTATGDLDNQEHLINQCAAWLGVRPWANGVVKHLQVSRSRSGLNLNSCRVLRGQKADRDLSSKHHPDEAKTEMPFGRSGLEEIYHISYSLSLGPLEASITLAIALPDEDASSEIYPDTNHEAHDRPESSPGDKDSSGPIWKARYLAVFNELQIQKAEKVRMKTRVLEAVS